jgi:RNA polymerase sigma-70 factor (ECF subfamily)
MQLLLQGCRKNDRESQRLLYQHYYAYAISICIRYSHSIEEAKEIVNDGFLKVFKKIDQYEKEPSFKAWLRRIMINTAIDHYRKELKHYYHQDIEAQPELETNEGNGLNQLSHEELIGLIQQLSPAYRTVFNLYVIDGYTHQEIAELLNISDGTSKSNLMKARAKLRKALEQIINKKDWRTIYV